MPALKQLTVLILLGLTLALKLEAHGAQVSAEHEAETHGLAAGDEAHEDQKMTSQQLYLRLSRALRHSEV